MKINVRDVNSIQPYLLEGKELFQGRHHPTGYKISINKYCVEKAKEEPYKYNVRLSSEIDFLFPPLESKYFLGTHVVWELCKRQLDITLVSASDYLEFFPEYAEVAENKENLRIIIPFFFFNEDLYEKYEPGMLDFRGRINLYTYLSNSGFNVFPFFNTEPQFKEETKIALSTFVEKCKWFTYSERANIELSDFVITDEKRELWNFAESGQSSKLRRELF